MRNFVEKMKNKLEDDVGEKCTEEKTRIFMM